MTPRYRIPSVPPGFIRFGLTETKPLDLLLNELREKHFAIVGPTGQRKTLFLLSVITQFLKLKDDCCFFIDFGGDQAALWILAAAAEAAGKPFWFVSLDNTDDSACWDPIAGTPAYASDITLATSGVTSGLSLLHGEGYGRKFWGRINYKAITEAFDTLNARLGRLPKFPELVEELVRQGKSQRNTQQVSEAYLAAEHLLRFDTLTGKGSHQLDIGQAIDEAGVVVFHIPSALRGEAARAVGMMAIWSILVEAAHRTALGKSKRYIHVLVDEYAQVASSRSAVDSAMVLARKWGVAMWVVFQDDSQLITTEGDLRSVIRSQCQRFVFARESKEEIDELRNRSLDILRPDHSHSLRGLSHSTSVREVLEPSLTRNEILALSGIAMEAYAVLRLGDQHRDPIPFTIVPPTASPAEHTLLARKPLPKKKPSAATNDQCVSPIETPDNDNATRQALLDSLLQKLHDEETWRLHPPTRQDP